MALLREIYLLLGDILSALFSIVTGRVKQRHRFEYSIAINASRELVWQMLRMKSITFDGLVPLHIVMDQTPGRPGYESGRLIIGEREMAMTTRIVDERPGKAILMEIVEAGTDPAIIMGEQDYLGFVLEDAPNGMVLNLTRELIPRKLLAQMSVPFGLRSGARRYKKKAEQMAGGAPATVIATEAAAGGTQRRPELAPGSGASNVPPPASAASKGSNFGFTRSSMLWGLVAFASFAYLWGWRDALLISAIIILHELGHALAMVMVGIPVKGIYLVPFFGGAAIAAAPYKREGQIGFVALMGPGFSLVPTIACAAAAYQTGNLNFVKAAEMSAIINLLNLVPIMPLDGGQVLKAALVSMHRIVAQIAGLVGAALGFWIAWSLRDPIIGLFVGLGLMMTLQMKKATVKEPLRWPMALLLLLALLATMAAYAAIIFVVNKRPSPF